MTLPSLGELDTCSLPYSPGEVKGTTYTGYLHLIPDDYRSNNVFLLGAKRAYKDFVQQTNFDEKYFISVARAQEKVESTKAVEEEDLRWVSGLDF